MAPRTTTTLICDSYSGSRGTAFTRLWLPTFINLLVGITDDSGESLANNALGNDEGSAANPFAALPPAASDAAIAVARKREAMYRNRCGKTFAMFYQHISDVGYREKLNAIVKSYSAQNPPVNARTGPIALQTAYDWFAAPVNGIQLQLQNTEWTNLTMVQLGVNKNSPNLLFARLLTLNSERQLGHEYNYDAICTKFLSSLLFPEQIAHSAMEEMNAPKIAQNIVDPLLRLNRVVSHFQNLWEAHYDKGHIKFAAPKTNPTADSGNRVDGFKLDTQCDAVTFRDECTTVPECSASDDDHFVYEMRFTSGPRKGEILCYNCLGAGHTSKDCSSKQIRRNKQDHIRRLAQGGGDLTITRKRKPFLPRPPSTGPRSRFSTNTASAPKYAVKLVEATASETDEETTHEIDEEHTETSELEMQATDFFSLRCVPTDDCQLIDDDCSEVCENQTLFDATVRNIISPPPHIMSDAQQAQACDRLWPMPVSPPETAHCKSTKKQYLHIYLLQLLQMSFLFLQLLTCRWLLDLKRNLIGFVQVLARFAQASPAFLVLLLV